MQENDFFTWRRAMLLRFQEMAAAEDVYTELQYQTQRLEFDYYALCVRHPVPFTRPKISLRTTYPPAWVTHYQSENYFAIDPVLKPEISGRVIYIGMTCYFMKRRRCGMPPSVSDYAEA